jgi:hypothetical protein
MCTGVSHGLVRVRLSTWRHVRLSHVKGSDVTKSRRLLCHD